MSQALAIPATAALARVASGGVPLYVTAEQARAIIAAAAELGGSRDRLLVETLWQSGGRATEVLRLRPLDVDRQECALRLVNLKQRRRAMRAKLVYVDRRLVADLLAYCRDFRIRAEAVIFASSRGLGPRVPLSQSQAWRIVARASDRAGVRLATPDGSRPANPRDFRHGSAVNQVRQGVPLSEVAQQLGHARMDSTAIYARLAAPERRMQADGVSW